MKKLVERDKKLRLKFKTSEKKYFILSSISKNNNISLLVRLNAFLMLDYISKKNSKVSANSRCLETINKKNFNKITNFSRYVFLKNIRNGLFSGIKKSAW